MGYVSQLASFVLAWRFALKPAWHGWALYSVLTGITVIVLFIVTNMVAVRAERARRAGAPIGILQRSAIIVGWSWLMLLAVTLLA